METNGAIRIIMADDHAVFREGLKAVLKKGINLKVAGEAEDGHKLVELYKKIRPDVILTDILMPEMDGVEATKRIIEHDPEAKVIALSMYGEERMVVEVMEAGARGYLVKNAGKVEILEAIDTVYKGKTYISNSISYNLLKLISQSKFNSGPDFRYVDFNETELSIIRDICEEKSSKEIGERLNLSPRTIEGHRADIMDKLGVKTKVGVVIYAIRRGLC